MLATLLEPLSVREKLGNLRTLTHRTDCVDFASNDYLGLARNSSLQEEIMQAWNEYPTRRLGATGSRLLTGHHPIIDDLEASISSFHNAETGLLFNSGYSANLGLISTIAQPADILFFDRHIHASSHDGMRLSKARSIPWRHNDTDHLEHCLKSTPYQGFRIVLVESIYSCDGAIAPITEICEICERYQAHLIVDEAHATGVIGENGEGLVSHLQCQQRVFARIHTFSKALGCYGAIILGSHLLKKYLINFCRSFIYATALPMPILLGIHFGYQWLPKTNQERSHLHQLIHHFKQHAAHTHLPLIPSNTPIQSIEIPGNFRARSLAALLQHHNFDVRPLLSPTVKKGKECLRICLHAFNTISEVTALINLLNESHHG